MYNEFYHFKEDPFNLTPDPRYLFLTQQHREALMNLLYGIHQRKGFICLTGEVGTGKTTLCRRLLRELSGKGVHTALILNPMLTETQLLKSIVTEFGLGTKHRDRLGYLNHLNKFLLKVNAAGETAVVIIDETQDMPDATLEMTRLLSNLETEKTKLLQIVLVGQPEMRAKLRKEKFRQLDQRITVRYHLGQMSREETAEYIRHRLDVAATAEEAAPDEEAPAEDGNGKLVSADVHFDRGAVREIFRYSNGTPRLVNAVGDKALLAGYVNRTPKINRRIVRRAIQELKGIAS